MLDAKAEVSKTMICEHFSEVSTSTDSVHTSQKYYANTQHLPRLTSNRPCKSMMPAQPKFKQDDIRILLISQPKDLPCSAFKTNLAMHNHQDTIAQDVPGPPNPSNCGTCKPQH